MTNPLGKNFLDGNLLQPGQGATLSTKLENFADWLCEKCSTSWLCKELTFNLERGRRLPKENEAANWILAISGMPLMLSGTVLSSVPAEMVDLSTTIPMFSASASAFASAIAAKTYYIMECSNNIKKVK
ncbi:MAG: hypothetical protein LBQ49_01065 [Rickettsiales bacterium]|jgi:hypothetical protein|nr:hypothetical protein [Rickettsiales bacterium]